MYRLFQALGLVGDRAFAPGQIGVGVHARHIRTQANELQCKIVAGVERGETFIQRGERRASIGGVRIGRQNARGPQLRRQLFFDVAPAAVRIRGILGTLVSLHPLDGIEGTRAMRG